MMEKLSPSLRSKLCLHIFGSVVHQCPFLAWMTDDAEAVKKLCLRMKAEFFETSDVFISYGEINQTIFILVNGCVTLCLGDLFRDEEGQNKGLVENKVKRASTIQDSTWDQQQRALERTESKEKIAEVQHRVQQLFSQSMSRRHKEPEKGQGRYSYVTSPAFFGESNIFLPEPEPAQYSARCKTRVEFTILGSDDVQFVVSELPHLRLRFEDFAREVKARWSDNDTTCSPRSPASEDSPLTPPEAQSPKKRRTPSGGRPTPLARPVQEDRTPTPTHAPKKRGQITPKRDPSGVDSEESEEEFLRRTSKDLLLGHMSPAATKPLDSPDLFPHLRVLFGYSDRSHGEHRAHPDPRRDEGASASSDARSPSAASPQATTRVFNPSLMHAGDYQVEPLVPNGVPYLSPIAPATPVSSEHRTVQSTAQSSFGRKAEKATAGQRKRKPLEDDPEKPTRGRHAASCA